MHIVKYNSSIGFLYIPQRNKTTKQIITVDVQDHYMYRSQIQ